MKSLPVEYEFNGEGKKIDFKPVKYDYEDLDGYTFYHHDILSKSIDEKVANHTFLDLRNGADFADISVENEIDTFDMVLFTAIKAPNGKYLKNIDDRLYAVTDANDKFTSENMFKIYKARDGKNGFLISQNTKYATVKLFMNRFNIEMKERIYGDHNGIQHFDVYQIPGTNYITLCALMINPWNVSSIKNETQMVKDTYGDPKRFWSIYDKAMYPTVEYPRSIYEGGQNNPCMVKANGIMYNENYTAETLKNASNNYLFEATYFSDGNDRYIMVGYDGKVRWVKYHNDFNEKFFNRDVTVDKVIDDIRPCVLFECPYKTMMNDKNVKMNLVTLKNVLTPTYNYTVFDK